MKKISGSDGRRSSGSGIDRGTDLVTMDPDFGGVVRHPPGTTAGIVVLRPQRQTLASIQQVATVAGALLDEEVVAGRLYGVGLTEDLS